MEKHRSLSQWLGLTLRGFAMGAADVIPGVSGGTIAFITGIYEELITSISNINLTALKKLKNEGIASFWNYINGKFFLFLFLGIGLSIFTLSRVVTFLLEEYPILIWAFFFGLIVASILIMIKTVEKWKLLTCIGLVIGTGIATYVSLLHTTANGGDLWYIFLSGAIAICAMILPGISGAFLLVLLGTYGIVLQGLKEMDIPLILVFVSGCAVGILSFSHLLKFLFAHYKNVVLAILSGFLIGSLFKVWPWKNKIGDAPIVIHSDGKEDWMMVNVLPNDFIVGEGGPQVLQALLWAVIGFLLVYLLERIGNKFKKKDIGTSNE